jgi:CheY-like chemotaxis protein
MQGEMTNASHITELHAPPAPGPSLRGVYVGDDSNDRKLFLEAMAQSGFQDAFHCVGSAEELFDYLDGKKPLLPHIVFLNIHLPRMNGLEAFEKLRGDPSLRSIIVTLVRGEASSPRVGGIRSGAGEKTRTQFKPLATPDLLKVLKEHGYS